MHTTSPPRPSSTSGFSLPEIAMSIGILAVAFVSLFALLPVGLNGFRQSIDSSNETWIMQSLNSMIQTTDWEKIWGPTATVTKDIYYFDEEGRPTDTESAPSTNPAVQLSRIYQAKLFVLPQSRPAGTGGSEPISIGGSAETSDPATIRVMAVLSNLTNLPSRKLFDELETAERVATIAPNGPVVVRSFVVSRMNAVHAGNLNN
jgi:uncharacterized protein (TIGR02598 family)